MKLHHCLALACPIAVVLALVVFAAGYGTGWHDAFEESRVRSGEIKTPHYIIPSVWP